MSNKALNKARKVKNDEFYTRYQDIEEEVKYYKKHFEGAVVYCNCDSINSSFWVYFHKNFSALGLKKLYATSHYANGNGYIDIYTGGKDENPLACSEYNLCAVGSDGSFDSKYCRDILENSDIVVTNPPFSLFRGFINTIKHKKFLVIGNLNAIKYKDIFKMFMANKIWTGVNSVHRFIDVQGNERKFGNILWYTNMDIEKRYKPIELTALYDKEAYPKYDTYDAIEVSKTQNIPKDYNGIMGVPISFVQKYCPAQFEILGLFKQGKDKECLAVPQINGKQLYDRLAIRKRNIYDN